VPILDYAVTEWKKKKAATPVEEATA
jgi:hypothetical protein